MKCTHIPFTALFLILLTLAIIPVSAYMAIPLDSNVSTGDFSNLTILGTKDTFTRSEEDLYVVPWVGIVPGSELNKDCNMSVNYRYRLISPEGKNYDIGVDDPEGNYLYRTNDGVLLSSDGYAFNDSRAAVWFRVSSLIKKAELMGFSWPGIWTIEYYFGNFDCNYNGEYEKARILTFTLVDDSDPAATPSVQRTTIATRLAPTVPADPASPTKSGPEAPILTGATALVIVCFRRRKQ